MHYSDFYFYAASIFWVVWFLYIGGFFKWTASLYFRIIYHLTPPPRKPMKPMDMEKLAELMEIWSPSSKMPGIWSDENAETSKQGKLVEMDEVVVEGGFVLMEKQMLNC